MTMSDRAFQKLLDQIDKIVYTAFDNVFRDMDRTGHVSKKTRKTFSSSYSNSSRRKSISQKQLKVMKEATPTLPLNEESLAAKDDSRHLGEGVEKPMAQIEEPRNKEASGTNLKFSVEDSSIQIEEEEVPNKLPNFGNEEPLQQLENQFNKQMISNEATGVAGIFTQNNNEPNANDVSCESVFITALDMKGERANSEFFVFNDSISVKELQKESFVNWDGTQGVTHIVRKEEQKFEEQAFQENEVQILNFDPGRKLFS